MTVLLDTTVLIDALRRRSGRREELAELLADGATLATSVVNVAEVYAGMRSGEGSSDGSIAVGLGVDSGDGLHRTTGRLIEGGEGSVGVDVFVG